jgi:hypothetical protein
MDGIKKIKLSFITKIALTSLIFVAGVTVASCGEKKVVSPVVIVDPPVTVIDSAKFTNFASNVDYINQADNHLILSKSEIEAFNDLYEQLKSGTKRSGESVHALIRTIAGDLDFDHENVDFDFIPAKPGVPLEKCDSTTNICTTKPLRLEHKSGEKIEELRFNYILENNYLSYFTKATNQTISISVPNNVLDTYEIFLSSIVFPERKNDFNRYRESNARSYSLIKTLNEKISLKDNQFNLDETRSSLPRNIAITGIKTSRRTDLVSKEVTVT